jgi:hypothetical protein
LKEQIIYSTIFKKQDMMSFQNNRWQRDNIYHGLTPTNTSGPISGGKYREYGYNI